jgi:hypothetical protein
MMKKFSAFITTMVMILVCSSTANGQKIMKLDSELKANSKPLEAKRKGMSSVGKYEFGPYKIISGKAGWTKTTSNKKFFSLETTSESKEKASFVFLANEKDTVLVNTSTTTNVSETDIQNWTFLNQSTNNYIAVITPAADTIGWKMIVVSRSGAEVEGNYQAAGILTNGVIDIQIKEVKQWEDGKTPAFKMICGYEFFIENNSVAAVQSSIDTFQKKFVWLSQTLNDQTRLVLAAASAALMVHTDALAADAGN